MLANDIKPISSLPVCLSSWCLHSLCVWDCPCPSAVSYLFSSWVCMCLCLPECLDQIVCVTCEDLSDIVLLCLIPDAWPPLLPSHAFFLPSVLEFLPWTPFCLSLAFFCSVAFADYFLWTDHGLLINNTSIHLSVSGLLWASQFNLNLTEKHDCNSSFPPEKNCHQGNQIRSTLFVYPELYAIRDQKSLLVKVKPQSNKSNIMWSCNHFKIILGLYLYLREFCTKTSAHPGTQPKSCGPTPGQTRWSLFQVN